MISIGPELIALRKSDAGRWTAYPSSAASVLRL